MTKHLKRRPNKWPQRIAEIIAFVCFVVVFLLVLRGLDGFY